MDVCAWITSNLLLELRDDIDGLLQDHELSEWLTVTRVQGDHVP